MQDDPVHRSRVGPPRQDQNDPAPRLLGFPALQEKTNGDEHYPFHRDGLATNDLAHRFPKELLSFRSTFLRAEPQPSCEFPVKVFGKTPSQGDLNLKPSSDDPRNPEVNLNSI